MGLGHTNPTYSFTKLTALVGANIIKLSRTALAQTTLALSSQGIVYGWGKIGAVLNQGSNVAQSLPITVYNSSIDPATDIQLIQGGLDNNTVGGILTASKKLLTSGIVPGTYFIGNIFAQGAVGNSVYNYAEVAGGVAVKGFTFAMAQSGVLAYGGVLYVVTISNQVMSAGNVTYSQHNLGRDLSVPNNILGPVNYPGDVSKLSKIYPAGQVPHTNESYPYWGLIFEQEDGVLAYTGQNVYRILSPNHMGQTNYPILVGAILP